jgi:hypothetical protein
VVLIGPPELSSALQLPHMRQLKQRDTSPCQLKPLDRDGVYGYVGHRLMVAGATADRLHFTADALDLVYAATDGVPRVINRLCDRTLLRGEVARAGTIGPDLVRQAMADLQLVPAAPADAPVLAETLPLEPVPPLAEVLASAAAAETAPAAPAAVPPAPAAVAPVPAVETPVPGPDDLHALLALPPMASPALETVAVPPRAARPPVAPRPRARTPRPRLYREAPSTGRSRAAVATAALLVLGALSGLTLAVYWAWARPMVTERVALPPVRRPSMRIAAPLPAVLEPNIEAVGDPLELPQPPGANQEETPKPDAGPPRPVTAAPASAAAQSVWVVQVGAFADDARANVLVGQLAGRGFTAFKSATAMRSGTPLHLVLAGPYQTRAAAADALDKIEEIPGVGQPILQLVPPAAALR